MFIDALKRDYYMRKLIADCVQTPHAVLDDNVFQTSPGHGAAIAMKEDASSHSDVYIATGTF
jgi:hypothetical protein